MYNGSSADVIRIFKLYMTVFPARRGGKAGEKQNEYGVCGFLYGSQYRLYRYSVHAADSRCVAQHEAGEADLVQPLDHFLHRVFHFRRVLGRGARRGAAERALARRAAELYQLYPDERDGLHVVHVHGRVGEAGLPEQPGKKVSAVSADRRVHPLHRHRVYCGSVLLDRRKQHPGTLVPSAAACPAAALSAGLLRHLRDPCPEDGIEGREGELPAVRGDSPGRHLRRADPGPDAERADVLLRLHGDAAVVLHSAHADADLG